MTELVLQIMTMPADTNPNGKIFGGWVLAKMDQAAATVCSLSRKNNHQLSLVTVRPRDLGWLVSCSFCMR